MHVLTKIFIVLVSLLAVLLVPLVVVYSHNENSYQGKYQQAMSQAAAARNRLETATARHGRSEQSWDLQIHDLEGTNSDLSMTLNELETELRVGAARLTQAEGNSDEIFTKLTTLAEAVSRGQQLNETLIGEVRLLRHDALALERETVDLDEALRDTQAQLQVAVGARRALQEELQRMKEEYATALGEIQQYVATFGEIDSSGAVRIGVLPDEYIDANIVNVRRDKTEVFAVIDVGSRDGVKKDWVLTIARGGHFVARLHIIDVDINRSVGKVELEDRTSFQVQEGDRVIARPG